MTTTKAAVEDYCGEWADRIAMQNLEFLETLRAEVKTGDCYLSDGMARAFIVRAGFPQCFADSFKL